MLRHPKYQTGFNLVEMMISLVVGLVVSGAIIIFIGASIQTTNASVQSTRLNQELRALAEVIAREVRRSRSVQDALVNLGSGCDRSARTVVTTDDCVDLDVSRSLDLSTAGCVRFGYAGAAGGRFRAIRRAVDASGAGVVIMSRGTRDDTECTDAGTAVSSPLLNITAMTFENTIVNPGPPIVRSANGLNITLSGRLRGSPSGAQFEKTYQTTVFVRSGAF